MSGRGDSFGAAVAMSAAGEAIVTWTHKTKSGSIVQAAIRTVGASFSAPVNLSADGQDISFSNVAMNAAGDAIVAWPRGAGRHIVQATLRPAGASFGSPIDLSRPAHDALNSRVAIDPAGNAIVTWNRESNGTTLAVQTAIVAARGMFSVPIDLSAPGRDGLLATPAMDAFGNAMVVWFYDDPDVLKDAGVVQMSARLAGGDFSAPVNLSGAGYPAEDAGMAMNLAGSAIAVWTRATGETVFNRAGVQAALRPPGGPFAAPVDITSPHQRVGSPQAAIDRSGNAIVVWTSHPRHGGGSVRAAVYQEAALPRTEVTPTVTGLRLGAPTFRAARSGPTIKRDTAGGGTRVSYSLSVAARVRFTVQHVISGRRVGGRCAPTSKTNRSRTRCTRLANVPGSFARVRPAGRDRFVFSGRVAGRRLGSGRYRLIATPSTGGLQGAPAHAAFRIAP